MRFDIGQGFTPAERNALIRFAVAVGTRAKCATRSLLRPLKMRDLQSALREQEGGHRKIIEEYSRKAAEYEAGVTPLSQAALSFFEGVPSKEHFAAYCNDIIRQEQEVLRRSRREYQISVSYGFLPRKLLRFHRSLSPRVTFGYSNVLHEECDFVLTDEVRRAFLASSLAELPQYKGDWTHDFGYVYFGSLIELFYEDLTVFAGERCILETVSHEGICGADFTDEELERFLAWEGKPAARRKLVQKLRAAGKKEEK